MATSTLEVIYDVNDPNQSGWVDGFLSTIPAIIPAFVRGDKTLAITLRPVHVSTTGTRPWDDDWESGDEFSIAIGLPDETATDGTFALDLNGQTSGLTVLAYNISAANLQTPLSAASVTAGFGPLTVSNPATGVYVVTWTNVGSSVVTLVADPTNLVPACDIIVSVLKFGNETPTTHPQQIISLRQQALCLSQPATLLPTAGVTRTYDQTSSATQNNIVRISFDADGTYAGLYSITAIAGGFSAACGQAGPLFTPVQLGLVLANHPAIFYQDATEADNIIVTTDGPDFLVEFTGTLAGSALVRTINGATVANPSVLTTSVAHLYRTGDSVTITSSAGTTPSLNGTYTITKLSDTTFSIPLNVTISSGPTATVFNNTEATLTVANVSLLAPTGVSGVLNLNTYNLAAQFWASDENELTFELSIERRRSSGEVRTSLLVPVVVKRDIIDLDSLVPTLIPTNLTQSTGVNFNGGITDLTGGSAICLDGVATADLPVPFALYFVSTDYGGVTYVLTASTAAESEPGFVRPDDYAGGSNEKVWIAAS